MTPSEIYAHSFQNSEPKHYTRLPNIIDHLTYEVEENGVKKIKRLSVYAKELYRVIRMIASDHGTDWHTTESLAEIIGCSVGSVVNAKKELMMPMIQLENNPLIIESRKQITKKVGEQTIKTTLCTRIIVDIWKWNNAFMSTINYQNKFGRTPDSCGESRGAPLSCGESAPQGPHSCGEANKITLNKSSLFKEQHPTAEADSVCSLDKKKSVLRQKPPSEPSKLLAFNHLIKNGFDAKAALSIVNDFTAHEINEASKYVAIQLDKKRKLGEIIKNEQGYLRKALQGKYWKTQKD